MGRNKNTRTHKTKRNADLWLKLRSVNIYKVAKKSYGFSFGQEK